MTDHELINQIADRAIELGLFEGRGFVAAIVTFAHQHHPLRLADLLAAKDHDFGHDVGGIAKHLDTNTGDMGGFLPRYHQRKPK